MLKLLLLGLSSLGLACAFSSGPPERSIVCNGISPNPDNHGAPAQAGNGGYVIATDLPLSNTPGFYDYTAGQTYIGENRLACSN